jgi:hypothetical protein
MSRNRRAIVLPVVLLLPLYVGGCVGPLEVRPAAAVTTAPPAITRLTVAVIEDGSLDGISSGLNQEQESLSAALLQAGFRVVPPLSIHNLEIRVKAPTAYGSHVVAWNYSARVTGAGGELVAILKAPDLGPTKEISLERDEWVRVHETASADLVNSLSQSPTLMAYAGRTSNFATSGIPVATPLAAGGSGEASDSSGGDITPGQVVQMATTIAQGVEANMPAAHEQSFGQSSVGAPAVREHTEHFEAPHHQEEHHVEHAQPCKSGEHNCNR